MENATAVIWKTLRVVSAVATKYAEAAIRLRERFRVYLGLDFETAYNLIAFLVLRWFGSSGSIPHNPDAVVINRRTWLENTTIPIEALDRYLDAVAFRTDEIPAAFDALGAGMSFDEILPFRRRPLFRIDADGIGFLCPQFLTEKGGVDLLWLLTHEPGGAREERHWTEDFGLLVEGYVCSVLEGLGPNLGGRFISPLPYPSGEIDALIHAGRTLAVIETKASLVRQPVLSRGTVEEVRGELERKFVEGRGGERKGVAQLVDAIHWLAAERHNNHRVRDIDLAEIDTVLPILVVADRVLRFPGLGMWFDLKMEEMLRRAALPWEVGPLTICGLEDLENLEQVAGDGRMSVIDVLSRYQRQAPRAGQALWEVYPFPPAMHPRLDRVMRRWMSDLRTSGVVLK